MWFSYLAENHMKMAQFGQQELLFSATEFPIAGYCHANESSEMPFERENNS